MDFINNFTNFITGATGNKASSLNDINSTYNDVTKDIYNTDENTLNIDLTTTKLSNWYKQLPYGFKFGDNVFYLPISPSNLSISTHFSTNVIATMYGTVEEHSNQRYFDISITGTTGMSPQYYQTINQQSETKQSVGRSSQAIKGGLFSRDLGFFKRTQALLENTLNQASDLFSLTGPKAKAGIDLSKTGYVAFHNFYKFLLLHKKIASGELQNDFISAEGEDKGLYFLNYKDNNQYNVSIQNFQLTRDASNPMLYNYSINMRAYNLQTVDTKLPDKYSNTKRYEDLGLDGVKTSFGAIAANKARQAKNTAYSAIAAVKGFGA